jgi:hypothetical protein
VNLNAGYHIHAITDCLNDSAVADPHAPVIGIAMDGVSLHSRLNSDGSAPEDLDECGATPFLAADTTATSAHRARTPSSAAMWPWPILRVGPRGNRLGHLSGVHLVREPALR